MTENIFIPPIEETENNDFFAEVAGVYDDGLSLMISGEETEKHYAAAVGQTYNVGDTVKVLKIRGTYIIEYIAKSAGGDSPIEYATKDYVNTTVEAAVGIALEGSY